MTVADDTAGYEAWLGGLFPLEAAEVALKHARMADPADPFPFFRATYYRWVRTWAEACPGVAEAPPVLAVGDLHVENFGTWRDADGRLCWGVNDFDEADEVPYTNDLVRLAASVRVARKAGALNVKLPEACDAILGGYRHCLESGGRPFVLEEDHPRLRAVALSADRDPVRFWGKLAGLLTTPPADPPPEARQAMIRDLPPGCPEPSFRVRAGAGAGSLGRPRFVGLVRWCGGWVCREAKAAAPPATAWAAGRDGAACRAAEAVGQAVRSRDPFYRPGPNWVARRLAPHCSRVELAALKAADLGRVLRAMGEETANVHLGTPGVVPEILRDLDRRPAGWLADAARAASDAALRDRDEWRSAARLPG